MAEIFSTPLNIIKCKVGDVLLFEGDDLTPYFPLLSIKDQDGTVLYGPVAATAIRGATYYWAITIGSGTGTGTVKTYYQVAIEDSVVAGYPDTRYIIYVTDDYNFEQYIVRSLGLAGHNYRAYNHVWTRGLLTQFDIRIYQTAAALDIADAGGTDTYLAHYRVTIRYNDDYNSYYITSVKQ